MEKVILDTNILIEILKNNVETSDEVEKFDEHYISAITQMELYYGALNKVELEKLDRFLNLFNIIQINEDISAKAAWLIYNYSKSHSLDIPDSLIAATSLEKGYKLFTYNKKDFKFISGIDLIKL